MKLIKNREDRKNYGKKAFTFTSATAIQLLIWWSWAEAIIKSDTSRLVINLAILPLFITSVAGIYYAILIPTEKKSVKEVSHE